MCPPIIAGLALLGGGSAAAGAGIALTAGSALYAGFAQKQAADYQADVAKNNAAIAERKRGDTIVQGQHERDTLRLQYAQEKARGQVAFAGGNVQLGTGSPSAWSLDLAQGLEVDLAVSRDNAERRAEGFLDQRSNFLSSAAASEATGRNALIGGALQAGAAFGSAATRGGTLLGSATVFRGAPGRAIRRSSVPRAGVR